VAAKALKKPTWWKNTFFWFAAALLLFALWGLVAGEHVIRDPGQIKEGGLVLIYLGGAVAMFVHGLISHQQASQHFEEESDTSYNPDMEN
jgi:hypothetical protein